MPTTMALTAKGQFTFNKGLLEHIKVKAGERVVIKKQPDASLRIEAERAQIDIMTLAGSMASPIKLTDDELNEAIGASYVEGVGLGRA